MIFPLSLGVLSQSSGAPPAPTLQDTAKLSFGYSYDPSTGGDKWNVISSTSSSFGLQNPSDASTGWSAQGTTTGFDRLSTNVTGASATGLFPETARDQAFKVDYGNSPVLTLSGLDDTATYDIVFTSTRSGSAVDYQGYFTVNGGDQKLVDAKNENTAEWTWEDISSSSGAITVEVVAVVSGGDAMLNGLIIYEYK